MPVFTYKLLKKRNKFGEYVIRCYCDEKHYEARDYFANDKEDAIATLKFLQESDSDKYFKTPIVLT